MPAAGILQRLLHFVKMHAAVYGQGRHIAAAQLPHLVFHQRYQRGNHQAQAVHGQGGYLVTYRLAATGRQERQGIIALQHRTYDGFLSGTESIISKGFLEYVMNGGGHSKWSIRLG